MVKTIGNERQTGLVLFMFTMIAFNLGYTPSAYIIFKKKRRALKAQLEIEEGKYTLDKGDYLQPWNPFKRPLGLPRKTTPIL